MSNRLVLEIDGPKITAEKFEKGIRSFLGLIKGVAKEVSGQNRAIRWFVEVEPGSLKIIFEPEPERAPIDIIPKTVDAIEKGISLLETGAGRPPYFSDKTLRNAHELASIINGDEPELDKVSVWRDRNANPISSKTLAYIDSLFSTDSKDWGTIEGKLSVLSERRGYQFVVYDPVTSKPTRCYFKEDILEEVLSAFGKRVSVSGLIRYRSSEPVNIRVDEFSVFPESDSLPGITDVRGILKRSG